MMKTRFTVVMAFLCFSVFFGCEEIDEIKLPDQEILIDPVDAMIDLSSPSGVQPYILEGSINKKWTLEWSDEFEGEEINLDKWNVTVSEKPRAARPNLGLNEWYWKADHAFLDGTGELTLRASKLDNTTMYCGSIDSRGKYEPKYGYIEIRMKIAETSKGNHTAFWFQGSDMSNVDGSGNDGAEIDVVESAWLGDYTKSVIHIDGYGVDHKADTKQWAAPNIHSGYHVYGLRWTSSRLEIYYDGFKKAQYTNANWIPKVEEWLWLSVGASFADGDFQSQPVGVLSDAKVDYVRVWKPDSSFDPTSDAFRIVNKKTSKWIKTYGVNDDAEIKQSPASSLGDWTHWRIQYTDSDFFYFVNTNSGKYFRPISNDEGSFLQLKPTSFSGSWTHWKTIDTGDGDGSFYIMNRQTGKYIRPKSADDNAEIVLISSSNTDDWQKWYLVPVD